MLKPTAVGGPEGSEGSNRQSSSRVFETGNCWHSRCYA
jgi:hypothetical protein